MGKGIGSDNCSVKPYASETPEVSQDISVVCDRYTNRRLSGLGFEGFGGQTLGLTGLERSDQLNLL